MLVRIHWVNREIAIEWRWAWSDTQWGADFMWLSNLTSSLCRVAAIQSFSLISRVPVLTAFLPSGKIRRLVSTAALPDLKYEGIYSQSVYAPWLVDAEF